MDVNKFHLSQRGIPLLYSGLPCDKPVLTLENYGKWYGMYLFNPDGSVSEVDVAIISEVMDKDDDALWVDHLFSPRLLYRVAQKLGCIIDERCIEVALGRWIIEGENLPASTLYLPPKDGPDIEEV